MSKLPINLEDLLRQRKVESDRIEYKAGWNPARIIPTLCAFANDFENLGGGYVVIGQDCDADGRPVFPPVGLNDNQLDSIQQELLRYCSLIQPGYFPILSLEKFEGRNLIVLWAPGGQNRPYSAPRDVTAKHKEYRYYIRRYANTVQTTENSEEQHQQIRSALRYLENEVLVEKVIKLPDWAEARRFFNYPLPAIEEVLVNAIYHRGYDCPEPVEVRVNPDCIQIVSYPGPDPSIRLEQLESGPVIARRYRNRRIGEFLKELELTEGRGTGIPKIKRVMKANGSPEPAFSTDEIRSHFLAVLPLHPEFAQGVETVATDTITLSSMESTILETLKSGELGRSELADRLGVSGRAGSMRRAIDRLIELGLVEFTRPDTPRSPNQKLRLPAPEADS